MKLLQQVNPEAEETPFIKMQKDEEVEGQNNEGEETKVERQKNMKQMLAEATPVHLLLAKSFYNIHLVQKSTLRFESCYYDTYSFKSKQ